MSAEHVIVTESVSVRSPGLLSSVRQDWATPRRLFRWLDREFRFKLDACATVETRCCEQSFYENGLEGNWAEFGSVWCNPPYGRKIGDWIQKGYQESRLGCTVVMLLPARTDTQWFHDYCLKGEVRLLRGRLCFDDNPRKRAPFPSMIVIFRPEPWKRERNIPTDRDHREERQHMNTSVSANASSCHSESAERSAKT